MSNSPARPVLRAGTAELTLAPADGGRIAALAVGGVDLIKTSGVDLLTWGCYPMAPWAGRLRDGVLRWRRVVHQLPTHLLPPHGIHGTVLERAWTVAQLEDRSATLVTDLGPDWPFSGRVIHRVTLAPDTAHATLTVESDNAEFPAIVGWHPWFPRQLRSADGVSLGGLAEVVMPAAGMLERGPDYLPTGRIIRPIPPEPWDDCFVDLAGAPGVRWPGAMEVALESDVPTWVAYTYPPDAVCVEPQSGPPDGLNTDAHAIVAPGRPLVVGMTIRWRRLAPESDPR